MINEICNEYVMFDSVMFEYAMSLVIKLWKTARFLSGVFREFLRVVLFGFWLVASGFWELWFLLLKCEAEKESWKRKLKKKVEKPPKVEVESWLFPGSGVKIDHLITQNYMGHLH